MKETPREKTTLASFLGYITKEIISIYDDRIVKRTGSENDFGFFSPVLETKNNF